MDRSKVSRLAPRRALPLVAVLIAAVGLLLSVRASEAALRPTTTITGWALATVVLVLALLGPRKRLAALPLGNMSLWLQLHGYFGLFSLVLFAVHAGWGTPHGLIEALLWWLFVLVAVGGVLGALGSRWIARRLTARGGEVIFEQIAHERVRNAEFAHQTVALAMADGASTLAQFHANSIDPFLGRLPLRLSHLTGVDPQERALHRALAQQLAFLDPRERQALDPLHRCITRHGELAVHRTLQGLLKGWLFLHIGATAMLLLVALAHAWLALSFTGVR